MPYEFLDDAPLADVGFEASGSSLAECFRSAADATLETMLSNPASLREEECRKAHVENEELEIALVQFLEELIYHKDAGQLLLKATDVHVSQRGNVWVVDATLKGESIDLVRHELANDVKAVTVHRLKVERTDSGWKATVVLDV